jgi:small nuclear ribonucleoprotein (snRNP)-like protein
MFIKSGFFRLFAAASLIFALAVFAFADTIRLKDGSIIKGRIVSFDGGKFIVLIDDGTRQRTLNFSADEVESITFDSAPLPVSANNSSQRNPPTIKTEGNSTIITVGQDNPKNSNSTDNSSTTGDLPPMNSPRVITQDNSNPPPQNDPVKTTVITSKPITIKISVLADNTSNGWTNSGWVVRRGQKIKIRGSGRVSLGNGRMSSPGGISSLPDNDKLVKNQPTGALIAVIGGDNNDFIFVGNGYEFVAARDGDLFLGVNEGNLNDNSGSYEVVIEIDPNIGN